MEPDTKRWIKLAFWGALAILMLLGAVIAAFEWAISTASPLQWVRQLFWQVPGSQAQDCVLLNRRR